MLGRDVLHALLEAVVQLPLLDGSSQQLAVRGGDGVDVVADTHEARVGEGAHPVEML